MFGCLLLGLVSPFIRLRSLYLLGTRNPSRSMANGFNASAINKVALPFGHCLDGSPPKMPIPQTCDRVQERKYQVFEAFYLASFVLKSC